MRPFAAARGVGDEDRGILETGRPVGAIGMHQVVAWRIDHLGRGVRRQAAAQDVCAAVAAWHVGTDRGDLGQLDSCGFKAIADGLKRELDLLWVASRLVQEAHAVLEPVQPFLMDCNGDLAIAH